MGRGQECVDLNGVRIPPDVLSALSGFCSDLETRILEDAARLRASRQKVDRNCVLATDDLLAVVEASIKQATSNLDAAFSRPRTHHVRRAS